MRLPLLCVVAATASLAACEPHPSAHDRPPPSRDAAVAVPIGDAAAPPEDGVADASTTGLSVAWLAPHAGQSLSGVRDGAGCEVAVAGGVARVDFSVDGTMLGGAAAPPFRCVWDATLSAGGPHQLSATASDSAGHSVSATIEVTRVGTTFWANSTSGSDANDGHSPAHAWKTMAKVLAHAYHPGDAVHLAGTLTDKIVGNLGSGTADAPISLIGDGPFAGRARVDSVELTDGAHLELRNLEASGAGKALVALRGSGTQTIRFVRLVNLYLHDADYGGYVGSAGDTDITFADTIIQATRLDGVLLADAAGDRFSYIGGSITDTGRRGPQAHWALHGVYASGGHGHVFDGVTFAKNANGSGLSLRRGGMTVHNCRFAGGPVMLNYNNEDSAGTRLDILVYRNLFLGDGGSTGIYIGGNNDQGVDDPGNRWLVFDNTFVAAEVNLATSGNARFYDIYLRNNVFDGGSVVTSAPASGHVLSLSHNGWWKAGSPQGSANVTVDPELDANDAVGAAAYRDSGTAAIAPGVTMTASAGDPLGFLGAAPDIGQTER